MSNGDGSGKKSGFLSGLRQSLIDNLLSASQKHENADGAVDGDALKREQLAILGRFEDEAEDLQATFANLSTNLEATQAFAKKGARTLKELLVSVEPWSFDTLSQLDEKFGALPKGMGYYYLAPESSVVTARQANSADNIIRIPTAFGLVLDEDFERPGDELSHRSLSDWRNAIPAALSRIWTLRLLVLNGLLRRDELPAYQPHADEAQSVRTPFARHHFEGRPGEVRMDPSLAVLLEQFRDMTVFQYDSETE